MRRSIVGATLLLLAAAPVAAHVGSISYSDWIIRGRTVQVTARLTRLDASALPLTAAAGAAADQALGQYLVDHLIVTTNGEPCPLTDGPSTLAAAEGSAVFTWHLDCPGTAPMRIESAVLLAVIPTHLHFARVRLGDGPALERVLSSAERGWTLTATGAASAATTLRDCFRLGIEQTIAVPSHLVFLLVLVLIATTIGETILLVAGFALAQSLALALTVIGYIAPDRAAIEAVIGLSVALVAAENTWLRNGRARGLPRVLGALLAILGFAAWRGIGTVPALTLAGLALCTWCYFELVGRSQRSAPYRLTIAFLFGLVHGVGLAAALQASELVPASVANALLGFNAGVTIAQIAVVAAVVPLFALATRATHEARRPLVIDVGSTVAFAAGVFWFVSRAYG